MKGISKKEKSAYTGLKYRKEKMQAFYVAMQFLDLYSKEGDIVSRIIKAALDVVESDYGILEKEFDMASEKLVAKVKKIREEAEFK